MDSNRNTTLCNITGKSKATISEFSQGIAKLIYKMNHYDHLNVKLWTSQLDKLKSVIKDVTRVTLRWS